MSTARPSTSSPRASARRAACSPAITMRATASRRRQRIGAARARPTAPCPRRRRCVADAEARRDRPRRISVSTPTCHSPAHRADASVRRCSRARSFAIPTFCCSTSRPTISTSTRSNGWKQFLIDRRQTLLFVTHDRAFLRRVATRIIELDRGRLVDWGGDYDAYLERKEAALERKRASGPSSTRSSRREEVWIRTGIQARRTRNEGRVRALEALRVERGARRERVGTRQAAGAGSRALGASSSSKRGT